MNDPVNHPKHYNQGDVECIQGIRAVLGEAGFSAYCQGSAMKYLWRCMYKGKALEDLEKCKWYITELQRALQKDAPAPTWNEEWSHD